MLQEIFSFETIAQIREERAVQRMSGSGFQRNVMMIFFNNALLSINNPFQSIVVIKTKTEESSYEKDLHISFGSFSWSSCNGS